MNKKELILDTLALAHLESHTGRNTEHLYEWVLDSVKIESGSMGSVYLNADVTGELKVILHHYINEGLANPIDGKELKRKVKLACDGDSAVADAVDELVFLMDDPIDNNKMATSIRTRIGEYKRQVEVVEQIDFASREMKFNPNADKRTIAMNLIAGLTPLMDGSGREAKGIVSSLNFDDANAVKASMEQGQDASSAEGIMRTGWAGFNKMCGEEAGIRRGDSICIGALQHNYKSGTLLNLAKHIALYNVPYMLDPTKKPLIIFISLENNIADNILELYKSLRENELGHLISIKDINIDEASAYVIDRMRERGYNFEMIRAEAGGYGVNDLTDTLQKRLDEGYEIHACIVDYLNLFSKQGTVGGNDAALVRDLFRRARAWCNPKLITFITAHQLSSEAKFLLRQGTDCFVKDIAGRSYWDSCKSLDQELDMEVIQHIVKPGDGHSYLEFMIGKHRKVSITKEVDKYWVQRFEEAGAILDDVELARPLFTRSIGGGNVGGDGEGADSGGEWWS